MFGNNQICHRTNVSLDRILLETETSSENVYGWLSNVNVFCFCDCRSLSSSSLKRIVSFPCRWRCFQDMLHLILTFALVLGFVGGGECGRSEKPDPVREAANVSQASCMDWRLCVNEGGLDVQFITNRFVPESFEFCTALRLSLKRICKYLSSPNPQRVRGSSDLRVQRLCTTRTPSP